MNEPPNTRNDLWMPFAFSPDYQTVEWVKTDIASLRHAPFLDQRSISPATARQTSRVQDALRGLPAQTQTPPMIFHSAFCCSTLLAKALDKDGTCLSLKEPNILMSLANAKRMMARNGRPREEFDGLFRLVMHWLSTISPEPIVLKPTNAANNLLETVTKSGGKVLLMYSSLEDFLISVLKKGEACKSFFRTQFNIFSLDPCALAGIDSRRAMTFTDLQVATLVWRHQLELFQKHRANHMLLRDKDFLARKAESLTAAAASLDLPHSPGNIESVVNSGVFARDVKFSDQSQNAQAREQQSQAIRDRYKSDLDETLAWAKNLRLEGDIPAP